VQAHFVYSQSTTVHPDESYTISTEAGSDGQKTSPNSSTNIYVEDVGELKRLDTIVEGALYE